MNENKLNLTDIDLLIEESKKINFSSESEVRNLGIKYPENFKPILKESEENKPFINLQWIFNWVYRDRIK